MRVLDLFSGIGGFSLGLERAGMKTVAFCEYDKKAQLVLKKHWPEIPIYEDVRTLTGKQIREEIGAIDLICGGFPCQPFSVAGKQRGAEDDRHLWPEYFRLIQEIRPRWVIGENVAGLINMGLDQVLSNLESAGYSAEPLIIPACAVNAPHRRDRLWIIANANGFQRGEPLERSNSVRLPGKLFQADGRAWESQPKILGSNNDVPRRVDRLKQLGNAVVPQVVEVIGRAIMEIENQGVI